jgi:phosphoribosyl 1,2-cyclic phosphodiesterase
VRLLICGVRGSTPAPGPEFVRYGGNTSCIALSRNGAQPRLVLDGGTGLQRLSPLLNDEPFRGTILLTHLHWDHTHGLPFFSAGDRAGANVSVLMPAQGDPKEILERAISPPHFPVRPTELQGNWRIGDLEEGEHILEGFSIVAQEIPHKAGRMFGYRITDGRTTIAYLSDHSPIAFGPGPDGLGEYHDAAAELSDQADLLIHDAQHTAEEFPTRAHFGHSAVEYAVGLAETAKARRLLLFHHDPPRTDDQIDEIVSSLSHRSLIIEAAAESTVIDLG